MLIQKLTPLTIFYEDNEQGIEYPYRNELVIRMIIAYNTRSCILVENWSSMNILFKMHLRICMSTFPGYHDHVLIWIHY